jgi:predicted house-cleaning noncanonical NTP pyrophosphatase (MazG superfamily)
MSAYTTVTITREEAKSRIIEFIHESNNEKLADLMDVVGRDSLYNYFVVDYIEKDRERHCSHCGRSEE